MGGPLDSDNGMRPEYLPVMPYKLEGLSDRDALGEISKYTLTQVIIFTEIEIEGLKSSIENMGKRLKRQSSFILEFEQAQCERVLELKKYVLLVLRAQYDILHGDKP